MQNFKEMLLLALQRKTGSTLCSIQAGDSFRKDDQLHNKTPVVVKQLKRLVPARVKRCAKEALSERRLNRVLRRIRQHA
jgi:hypothetical protein